MNWERKTINDLCEIKGGKRLPKNHELVETATNHPYIRARDIGNGIIDFSKPVFLQESTFNFISRYIVKKDDIVLTIVGANIGDVGLIPKELDGANLTENAVKLTSFNDNCHFKYLLYYFLLPDKKKQLEQIAAGSAQGKLGLYKVKDIEVPIPPLPIQRRIASILSAYDDLIENNLKRIKLLEEKAQLHYKELMQDSSIWDKVRLEEFVSVVKGRKPANVLEQLEEESQPYLLLDTVERGKTLYTTDLSLPQSTITDVLMCMDGARSGLSFRGMVGAIGSTMAIWRSNSERLSGEFLYQFMKQNESAIRQGNTGAAIPHANRKFILGMKMAMPPKKEAAYFDGLTLPLVKLINTLHNQNTKLREARDILLPRLINGQIEV